jgi:hypothetical protein
MGKVLERITPDLRDWIERQRVFFVATAPVAGGHVNVSPKGHDTFRLLDDRTAAYLDLTGSGAETIAHLRENGRITVMFCAFEGPPRIVRLHGTGEVLRPGDDGFDDLAARFPDLPGRRSIVRIACERVSTSCGYSIPLYAYEGERDTLIEWAERRGPEGLEAYWAEKNVASIDGLPAL